MKSKFDGVLYMHCFFLNNTMVFHCLGKAVYVQNFIIVTLCFSHLCIHYLSNHNATNLALLCITYIYSCMNVSKTVGS